MPSLRPHGLRPYADRPLRLTAQVLADVLVLTWTALWTWVAVEVYRGIVALGAAGHRLQDAVDGAAGRLEEAGDVATRVPLAGDRLARPLTSAGSAAADVADAGRGFADAVTSAALPVALVIAVTTVLPLAVPWILLRARYARQAGATARLAASPAGTRLLALRALAGAPTRRLVELDPDPVAAWTRQDDTIVTALAALELRRTGLRPSIRIRSSSPSDRRT
jgi:hypothetical protein